MQTLGEIAASLEARRQALQLTFDELAKATGLTPLATRRVLRGQAAPRVTTLMALADRLGLEVLILPKPVAAGLDPAMPAAQRPLSRVERLTLPESPVVAPAADRARPAKRVSRRRIAP